MFYVKSMLCFDIPWNYENDICEMYVLSRHIVHTIPRALGGEYSVIDVIRRSWPDDCGMNSYQRFRVAPYVLVVRWTVRCVANCQSYMDIKIDV